MAGRPRKPHRLRLLEGKRGKSRPLTPDLAAPNDPLVAPKTLSKAEKVEWDRHVGWIRKLKIETSVDAGQLEAMVRMLCRARMADATIEELGMVMVTDANGEIRRPEVGISNECWKHYGQLADKFGLSATARAKLGSGEKKIDDPGDVPADLRG